MKANVAITHPGRVLFPASASHEAITKGDLIDYYAELAPVMVPHLDGRPLTLTRFPAGIDEEGFIQQNFAASLPDWMDRVEVARKSGEGTVVHPVVGWGRPTRAASRCAPGCPAGRSWTYRIDWCSTWIRPTTTSQWSGPPPGR